MGTITAGGVRSGQMRHRTETRNRGKFGPDLPIRPRSAHPARIWPSVCRCGGAVNAAQMRKTDGARAAAAGRGRLKGELVSSRIAAGGLTNRVPAGA